MDYGSKSRFGVWAILILVILNVTLMGILWYGHYKNQPRRPMGDVADHDGFMAQELEFDQPQAQEARRLKDRFFQRRDSLSLKISALSQRVMQELFAPNPDTLLVRAMCNEIGQLRADAEYATYQHFEDIKNICRPQQYDLLRNLVSDLIRTQQGPPPGEHRPPPPDGRRPPRGMSDAPPPMPGDQPPPSDGR